MRDDPLSLRKIGCYLVKVSDLLINVMAVISGVLVCALTVMICVSVLFRYFFKLSVGWSTEITEYMIFLIVMFGAPWVLKRDKHVVVDVVVNLVKPGVKRIFMIITSFMGIVTGGFLFYYGYLSFYENLVKGTMMVKVLPVPQYLPIFFIPLSAFFITIIFIRKFWNACFAYSEEVLDADDLEGF